MSKELKYIEELKSKYKEDKETLRKLYYIKKAIEALEIIKEKECLFKGLSEINKEEFHLLKEILRIKEEGITMNYKNWKITIKENGKDETVVLLENTKTNQAAEHHIKHDESTPEPMSIDEIRVYCESMIDIYEYNESSKSK